MGRILLKGKRSPEVWLQGPKCGACVVQGYLDKSLKSQTPLRSGSVGMAGRYIDREENSSGYEQRAKVRCLLMLIFFWICETDCHGMSGCPHGPSMRLPFWGFDPIPRVWGHSVGREEAFLFFFLFVCLFFFTSGGPPKEGFHSRVLGRGDWTTRTLVNIGT